MAVPLSAPLASALTMQFSHRAVVVVGGLLSASGLLLASLDLGLPWLYLTMGVLEGSVPPTPLSDEASFTFSFHFGI